MKAIDFDKARIFNDNAIDKMFSQMNKYDYLCIVNGCSPDIFPKFIAETISGSFYAPCARHDLAYYLGGNFKDKYMADKIFKKEMVGVSRAGISEEIIYGLKEEIFYNLVYFFGDRAFNHWMRKGGEPKGHLPSFNIKKDPKVIEYEKHHKGFKFEFNIVSERWVNSMT